MISTLQAIDIIFAEFIAQTGQMFGL